MIQLYIDFPQINPVLFQWGAISIHWYGVMYLLGFLMIYVALLYSPLKLTKSLVGDYIFDAALGVIIGGRLGYVLIYNLPYYYQHPLEIFSIWLGGMSFHGGLVGVVIATYVFCKSHPKIRFWDITDYIVLFLPFTLVLGRIGNFINGELYGRLTDVPWAMQFPSADGYRHPSQLYEAALHLVLGTLLLVTKKYTVRPKLRSGLFLAGYGIIRIIVEFFREPDKQIGYIANIFTLGQIITLPLIIAGIVVIKLAYSHKQ